MFQISPKHRKLRLSMDQTIPSLLEVRSSLGASLAQALFEHSHVAAKKLLDSIPSPEASRVTNDESNEDTTAKSTENYETLKTDIHHHIMEVGEELLTKHEKDIEIKLQKSIERRLEEKFHMFKAKTRKEMDLNTLDLHAKYESYISTVQSELEEKLEAEWANANAKCDKRIQKAVVQERMNVTHEMLRKMRIEISYVVGSLYDDFEQSFRAQRENIIADFNEIVRKEHVKLNERIAENKRKRLEDMCVQRHELEMQNITDVMYVLCLERLRNHTEKHAIHKQYEKELANLQELIAHLNKTIDTMKEEVDENCKRREQLEERIYQIIEEFKKFINFVFHAVPGQAEFLLPSDLLRLSN